MQFTVLFWNIWLDNQIQGQMKASDLFAELKRFIHTYQPDCIALNEVLQNQQHSSPFVIDFLGTLGYTYSHYAPASPINKQWLIGTAIISKLPLENIKEIEMGPDVYAAHRGFKGHSVKAIAAQVTLATGKTIRLVAAHPMHLRFTLLKAHYQHTRTLWQFLQQSEYQQNTIIGGDFNEPNYLPRSFRTASQQNLHHMTGTFANPTWRHNGWRITPIRANLDRLFWTKNGQLRLEKFEVVHTNVSDHRPLYARFKLG